MSADFPFDGEEFRRWRDEAGRALDSARVQAEAGLHNWSCFAAEQGAQLAAEALLHGLGRGPWGHDLVRLIEGLGEAGVEVPGEVADAARRLSRHYIPARYPDAHPGGSPGSRYSRSDADEAARDAAAVVAFVDSSWSALGA